MSSELIWDATGSDLKGRFSPELYNQLDAIFKPNNVALIGASERAGSVSRTILLNLLLTPFGGSKESGVGKEGQTATLLAMTQVKNVVFKNMFP